MQRSVSKIDVTALSIFGPFHFASHHLSERLQEARRNAPVKASRGFDRDHQQGNTHTHNTQISILR